jgi:enolase-phosphatase E1
MIAFDVRFVLLDIEGTTSSISFVYDQMFPFARSAMHDYCRTNWNSLQQHECLNWLAREAGFENKDEWLSGLSATSSSFSVGKLSELTLDSNASYGELADTNVAHDHATQVADYALQLMDRDSKATGLKQLQGLVWKSGFESGQLRSHFFDDVVPSLKNWIAAGIKIAIYSSGSVEAQKLFFRYSIMGDLSNLITAYFDTTTGPKREGASYSRIAKQLDCKPNDVLFLSDNPFEIEAAESVEMQIAAINRPGNAELPHDFILPTIDSFVELQLTPKR